MLGRYKVLRHLAAGGMADVLLGRSDAIGGFERHVVLKRIQPEYANNRRFIRMFLDEARVAATLHHQHIVQVYDVGEANSEYFIAMEYIHGQDVSQIQTMAAHRRTHVPLGPAIAIVAAAAAGLHYAHEQLGSDKQPLHIVHRDISPSNILVGYDGSVKVVDFGLAMASMLEQTRSRDLSGKVPYMSPEQCLCSAVDRRSDVYALGVVLYELATMTRTVNGESDFEAMKQIVHGRIAPPETRRSDLPAELCTIIKRAIATDRDQRFASADDLRLALEQFASRAAITTPPSAIAAYMRQVFGSRREPWLEFKGQAVAASADGPTISLTPGELPASNHQGDLASVSARRSSREMLSRAAARVPGAGWSIPAEPATPASEPARRHVTSKKVVVSTALVVVLAGVVLGVLEDKRRPRATIPARGSNGPVVSPAHEVKTEPGVSNVTVARESRADRPVPPDTRAPRADAPPRTETTFEKPSRPGALTRDAVHETPPRTPPLARPAPSTAAIVVPPAYGAAPSLDPPVTSLEQDAQPVPPVALPPARSPSPVTPAPARRVVGAAVLEARRTGGESEIPPDLASSAEMRRTGRRAFAGVYKICLAADGKIDTVRVVRSTGYPAYDAKIESTIFSSWRYRPVVVDGKPGPVCSVARISWSSTGKLGNRPTWE